jgi:hypothetical protein
MVWRLRKGSEPHGDDGLHPGGAERARNKTLLLPIVVENEIESQQADNSLFSNDSYDKGENGKWPTRQVELLPSVEMPQLRRVNAPSKP